MSICGALVGRGWGKMIGRVVLGVLLLNLAAPAVLGQMVTGERMKHFGDVFGVTPGLKSYPYDVVQVQSSAPGQILWPGEQPTWTLQIQNKQNTPIKGAGKIDVVQYGTRGQPGDIWEPDVFKINEVASVSVELDIAANGFQNLTIEPKLPETFGGYGVVVDVPGLGRRFALSAIRTFKPNPEPVQYPSLSVDKLPIEMLKRMGVQAIRMEEQWIKPDDKDYAAVMAELDRQLKEYKANNITVMYMIGHSGSRIPMPLGRGRPHLDENDVMQSTKQDLSWLPSEDAAFQAWVSDFCTKYGWPNGPVTAMSLWNEPWEGISISGWGADMLRYREIFKHMAAGVIQARKDAGVEVLLAGCDSSSNTLDKLFPDGEDTFLQLLDVCSIHYQGMSSPALYKRWVDRQSPLGRIRIWDTESWVANTDDRVAAVVAANKSAGYDRAMGVFHGNIGGRGEAEMALEGGRKQRAAQQTAWSTAASVAAAIHFVGDRPFKELLFQNGLPWVMVFDSPPGAPDRPADPDDGTIVVVGDLGETFEKDTLLFRTVKGLQQSTGRKEAEARLAALGNDATPETRTLIEHEIERLSSIAGATLTLGDGGGRFILYDFYGNPVSVSGGKIVVPLDGRGFFLRTDGSKGSFAALAAAVADARIEGIEPLEMLPHDLVGPIDSRPTLRLSLTNVLNRPVTGQMMATLGDLQIQYEREQTFKPHESREVEVKVVGGVATANNGYPLRLRFDAGADGASDCAEDVHVNVIARKTPVIDGKLDDWQGVLPQTIVSSGSAAPTQQEAAWFPFVKYDASIKKGLATAYLAYDDQYVYFAAKVADSTPHPGTLRFETRDDDPFFYPAISYEIDERTSFATKPGKINSASRKPNALLKPGEGPEGERSYDVLETVAKAMKLKFRIPVDQPRQIALYFLDDDASSLLGRRTQRITLDDAKTGKRLDSREVQQFGKGTYAVYLLSGDIDVTIRGAGPRSATLAGIFVDQPAPGASPSSFVKFDETTEGNWIGGYGKLGHHVIGTPAQYPAGMTVTNDQRVEKIEHRWPEGVRRFSYRTRPILPSGNAPNFDNVQIAFNSIPLEEDPVTYAALAGTMPKYTGYRCTDYEFALNQVADAYGGGTEIWRLEVPQQERKHFYPRQPKSPWEGAVKDGKLSIVHEGGTRVVESAIPWTEIPHVKALLDAGRPVKFSFRVNDDAGVGCLELARGRSVSRRNNLAFHCDWIEHWANEVEFYFAPPAPGDQQR